MTPQTKTEVFWSRVDKTGDCWTWTGSKNKQGYGHFWYEGRATGVHRISYRITNGDIPAGMMVCHRCDVPSCVNPEHLFLGTQKDNMHDATRKGRMATGDRNGSRLYPERLMRGDMSHARKHKELMSRGEAHGMAKLTEASVLEMRQARAFGATLRQLASRFGVSSDQVSNVVRRRAWRHV